MSNLDFFDLNKSEDLFQIIQEVYVEYIERPTERNFLFLALGLTHLREWIAQSNHGGIEKKKKDGNPLTDGEKFFDDIYDCSSFRVIQELCNRGKHHITCNAKVTTSKIEGFRAGLGAAGDRLDQRYFLIDGHDSRKHFSELIHKYNEWFKRNR